MSIPVTHQFIARHTDQSVHSAGRARLGSALRRAGVLSYGVACYGVGVAALLALIATTLGLVPFTEGPLQLESSGLAIAFNSGLLLLFAAQHSVMARPAFKARWTRVIAPAMERATYVLATALCLLPLLVLWQPVGGSLWSIESPLLRYAVTGLGLFGWAYLLAASFAIDHFELFGLRQVWLHFRGRTSPVVPFRERWMYRFDRHPIMTGVLLGMWATPDMSGGYLMFAAGMTLYVMVGVHFEERALRRQWGEAYEDYRRRVPTLVPLPFSRP